MQPTPNFVQRNFQRPQQARPLAPAQLSAHPGFCQLVCSFRRPLCVSPLPHYDFLLRESSPTLPLGQYNRNESLVLFFNPLLDTTLHAPTCNPHLDSKPAASWSGAAAAASSPSSGWPQEATKLAAVKAAEREGEELQQ